MLCAANEDADMGEDIYFLLNSYDANSGRTWTLHA
jgi:hypothetical protein